MSPTEGTLCPVLSPTPTVPMARLHALPGLSPKSKEMKRPKILLSPPPPSAWKTSGKKPAPSTQKLPGCRGSSRSVPTLPKPNTSTRGHGTRQHQQLPQGEALCWGDRGGRSYLPIMHSLVEPSSLAAEAGRLCHDHTPPTHTPGLTALPSNASSHTHVEDADMRSE